ncbi:hypothetical protein IWW50_001681 [Coemansia erecta]|nr:hypothetical protein IWW50_001681 [Coemansia erecta]
MQELSGDIVRLIAREAAALPVSRFGQEPVHIQQLLAVCRLWRAVSLPVYCASITVCTSADRRALYWARKGLSSAKAHALGWQMYARQALVVVSGREALDKPCAVISALRGVFLRISRVKLHLMTNPGPAFKALNAVFPAMREMKLEATNAQILHTMDVPISSLTHVEVTSCPAFRLSAASAIAAPLPSLRTLVLGLAGSNVSDALAFARQHAASLVRLEVKYIRVRDCAGLVLDEQNRLVEYTHVEVLKLDVLGAYDERSLAQRVAIPGTPFPSLCYLNCGAMYPFANSVLLRGALPTLRVLIIAMDMQVASWLLPDATCLRKYARLAGMEARIVSRAAAEDSQNLAVRARVLDAAFQAPQLLWLRIRSPNALVAEFCSKLKN